MDTQTTQLDNGAFILSNADHKELIMVRYNVHRWLKERCKVEVYESRFYCESYKGTKFMIFVNPEKIPTSGYFLIEAYVGYLTDESEAITDVWVSKYQQVDSEMPRLMVRIKDWLERAIDF